MRHKFLGFFSQNGKKMETETFVFYVEAFGPIEI